MSRFVLCLLLIAALLGVGWQAVALPLVDIALVGPTSHRDDVEIFLNDQIGTGLDAGSTVQTFDTINNLASLLSYSNFDTIVVMRTGINANPNDGSQTLTEAIADGVMLVTDHNFTGSSPTVHAIRDLGLSQGTNNNNVFNTAFGAGNPQQVLFPDGDASGKIGEGIGASYGPDGVRSSGFLRYTSINPEANHIGVGSSAFGDQTGIIEDGATILIGYNWAEDFGNASLDTKQLILNAVALNKPMGPGPGVIPEPSTLALFSIAILGVLGYGWRRRNQGDASNVDNAA
jgi:hypothetical protein